MTYSVQVTRSGNWWAISSTDVDGLHTQAKRLDQVPEMAAEAIGLLLDVNVKPDDIEIEPTDKDITTLVESFEDATKAHLESVERYRSEKAEVARVLKESGLPARDIAKLMNCSTETASRLTRH